MVAMSAFSGLVSFRCALASAAAIAPMVSLDRCMVLLPGEKVEADRARLRAFGANAMTTRFGDITLAIPDARGMMGVRYERACELSFRQAVEPVGYA